MTKAIESPAVYRARYGFNESFDIALAAAFEPEEIEMAKSRSLDSVLRFYERIGEIGSSIGKKIFLPHRDMDWKNGSQIKFMI